MSTAAGLARRMASCTVMAATPAGSPKGPARSRSTTERSVTLTTRKLPRTLRALHSVHVARARGCARRAPWSLNCKGAGKELFSRCQRLDGVESRCLMRTSVQRLPYCRFARNCKRAASHSMRPDLELSPRDRGTLVLSRQPLGAQRMRPRLIDMSRGSLVNDLRVVAGARRRS